jgi:hypothetical protein
MEVKPTNIPHKLVGQIRRCIELLGEEYTSLDYTIEIYQERERLEYERRNKPVLEEEQYEQILNGEEKPIGQTIPTKKVIRLYTFNLDDIENEDKRKVELIANLFHEIRHAWQYTNGLFLDEKEVNVIDNNRKTYFSLSSEKDAYLFQVEQMNKHKYAIFKIMKMKQIFVKYELKKEIQDLIRGN